MKHFKAKKGLFWIYMVCALGLPFLIFLDKSLLQSDYWWISFALAFMPFLLFLWIYTSTKYAIDSCYLYYQSAFVKGKLEIEKITEIHQNKTLWAGVKPAMATKGLIIKFGYDEIYIAPENNNELIGYLLKVNPHIIIK